MNAFETIGLPVRLALPPEDIDAAWRAAGKTGHPDAGGDERAFASLREARDTLTSPAARLAHWLELHGHAAGPRGTIAAEIMDLFGPVGEVTQGAASLARRRAGATTTLGSAMLEGECLRMREAVEVMIARVDAAIAAECVHFDAWESAPQAVDVVVAGAALRSLRFLEKWKRGLMAAYAGLV